MRVNLSIPTVFLAVLFVFSVVIANTSQAAPEFGIYYSTDLGGEILTGRFSESWSGPSAGYGQPGNTILASSVNGPAMGTQWEMWCASISGQPMLVSDVRDTTNSGEVTWLAEYEGGYFWMAGDGPWGDVGVADFTGTIEMLSSTITYVYADNVLVEVRSNWSLLGELDPESGEGVCVEFGIGNLTFVGTSDESARPEDYPPFMASDCGPWPAETGAWGTMCEISVHIRNCMESPVKEATWGAIKSLYTD
jgi:hypothetical protein